MINTLLDNLPHGPESWAIVCAMVLAIAGLVYYLRKPGGK